MRYPLLSRRSFLRSAGVCLALPVLDAMNLPSWAAEAKKRAPRRRMISVNHALTFYTPNFFPKTPGRDYTPSPYLDVIKEFRQDFTVFYGLSHPNVQGAHASDSSFLTSAPAPGASAYRNTISVDQRIAEHVGSETRFASMELDTMQGGGSSFTPTGIRIPTWGKPAAVFARLFLNGSPQEIKAQMARLNEGRSIMDAVLERSKRLKQKLGTRDREKLDEYFEAVRECEQNLARGQSWVTRPKPSVEMKRPPELAADDHPGVLRQLYDLMHLALQTDSTRVITLMNDVDGKLPIPGISSENYHAISHHGQQESKIEQLRLIDTEWMTIFRDFLAKMKNTREDGETLLDRTAILFGSHMSDANSHSNNDLPILVAGGNFKHGQFLKYGSGEKNLPLANLFVAFLHHFGLAIDKFGSSTATSVPGFELKS